MLSDKRVEELVDEISCFFEHDPGGLPSPRLRTSEAIVRTAVAEAVATNDELWKQRLSFAFDDLAQVEKFIEAIDRRIRARGEESNENL